MSDQAMTTPLATTRDSDNSDELTWASQTFIFR
jgi:hypothetical protein